MHPIRQPCRVGHQLVFFFPSARLRELQRQAPRRAAALTGPGPYPIEGRGQHVVEAPCFAACCHSGKEILLATVPQASAENRSVGRRRETSSELPQVAHSPRRPPGAWTQARRAKSLAACRQDSAAAADPCPAREQCQMRASDLPTINHARTARSWLCRRRYDCQKPSTHTDRARLEAVGTAIRCTALTLTATTDEGDQEEPEGLAYCAERARKGREWSSLRRSSPSTLAKRFPTAQPFHTPSRPAPSALLGPHSAFGVGDADFHAGRAGQLLATSSRRLPVLTWPPSPAARPTTAERSGEFACSL
jgi:hypothetical protein